MSERQVGHFFWHGKMSTYEFLCIQSFVKHNFIVKVWSYEPLADLPAGVERCDASEILPITELHTYKIWNERTNAYQSVGGINSGFSDLFRYTLLLKHGGWWFDADVVCLKDQSEFQPLLENRSIVVGIEDLKGGMNGAVMNFPSKEVNKLALEKCINISSGDRNLGWGAVGPSLVTDLVRELKLESEVLPVGVFYPIHFDDIGFFFEASLKERTKEIVENSHTLHLWNWAIINYGIDKYSRPPKDGFLYELFFKKK